MKPPKLSPRQSEILRLISRGKSNSEIADALKISKHTVGAHIKVVMLKLGAHSRAHAVALFFCR